MIILISPFICQLATDCFSQSNFYNLDYKVELSYALSYTRLSMCESMVSMYGTNRDYPLFHQ